VRVNAAARQIFGRTEHLASLRSGLCPLARPQPRALGGQLPIEPPRAWANGGVRSCIQWCLAPACARPVVLIVSPRSVLRSAQRLWDPGRQTRVRAADRRRLAQGPHPLERSCPRMALQGGDQQEHLLRSCRAVRPSSAGWQMRHGRSTPRNVSKLIQCGSLCEI